MWKQSLGWFGFVSFSVSQEYTNLILKLLLKTLTFSCTCIRESPDTLMFYIFLKFISFGDTNKNYYILEWKRLY